MDNDKTTEPCKRHDCKRVRAEMQAVVERVQAERDAALAECYEQARLNGMGAEREARLRAQVAELQAKANDLARHLCLSAEHEIATNRRVYQMEIERNALAKDAARYRWLRNCQNESLAVVTNLGTLDYGMSSVAGTYDESIDGEELDAAIDAAMKVANVR